MSDNDGKGEKPKSKLVEGWQPASNATGADPNKPPKKNPSPNPKPVQPHDTLQKLLGVTLEAERLKETGALSPRPDAKGADPEKPPGPRIPPQPKPKEKDQHE